MKPNDKRVPIYIAADEGDRCLLKGGNLPPEGVWHIARELTAAEKAADAARLARFKVGQYVRFKLPFRGHGVRHPEPRPYLVTKVDNLVWLEGYGPAPDMALVPARQRRAAANPWTELRSEYQRFLDELEEDA
jgi:hypothetical protein